MDVGLEQIVEQTLVIEKKAVVLYKMMSDMAVTDNLKKLWLSMSSQEKQHVDFWERLLQICRSGKIWNIFNNPDRILDEIKDINDKIDRFLENPGDLSDPAVSFLAAYRLEIIMLHPAFAAMFILMKNLTGDSSPADAYDAHIETLLKGLKEQGMVKPEFELIDDLARRLWERNTEIASQLAQINALHGVVPICMHCKKIRNDEGYWNNVEKYLKTGLSEDAMLSHGICPECMEKYCSDYIK